MKTNLPNRNGYQTLKYRIMIVLIIMGIFLYFMYELNYTYHNPGFAFIAFCAFLIISIITLFAPITIRYNGYERRV